MALTTRTFSDLDLNFTMHPVTKDITMRYDENAIKTSLKNLILTSNYERHFHSEVGTPIKRLLFEPAGPMTNLLIRQAIIDSVNNFEPRVVLLDVDCNTNMDLNAINVTITFKIVNTATPIVLTVALERTR